MDKQDHIWLKQLAEGEQPGLEGLFHKYYGQVCATIFRMINDAHKAEDLAQEVFYDLWKNREKIKIESSVGGYLRKTASNKTLNHIRDQKIKLSEGIEPEAISMNANQLSTLEEEDLKALIDRSIQALPDRCRLVFILSRDHEMTYKEIGESLGISIKTVENQISKALKALRAALGPYVGQLLIGGLLSFLA